jgi:hypothetical protein
MNFRLTPTQRYRLRQTRDTTHDANILRRCLAVGPLISMLPLAPYFNSTIEGTFNRSIFRNNLGPSLDEHPAGFLDPLVAPSASKQNISHIQFS